jgi:hypothetical protein
MVSSDNNSIVPHQLHGTQLLLPPKIQEIINRELEPNEQVQYAKVSREDLCAASVLALFFSSSHFFNIVHPIYPAPC